MALGARGAPGRRERGRVARPPRRSGRPRGTRAFVHPFDDPLVVAGQGTIGLELVAQVPGLRRVIVPVGGGGLISGVAIAVKSQRPEVEVIGVQVAGLRAVPGIAGGGRARGRVLGAHHRRRDRRQAPRVRSPWRSSERWVDGLVVVSEEEVAEAMVFLLERAKLVVEGAGAVGVAAMLAGRAGRDRLRRHDGGHPVRGQRRSRPARRRSCAATRARPGGAMSCSPGCPTGPGRWRCCSPWWASSEPTSLDVEHIREGFDLHVRESAVQLVAGDPWARACRRGAARRARRRATTSPSRCARAARQA